MNVLTCVTLLLCACAAYSAPSFLPAISSALGPIRITADLDTSESHYGGYDHHHHDHYDHDHYDHHDHDYGYHNHGHRHYDHDHDHGHYGHGYGGGYDGGYGGGYGNGYSNYGYDGDGLSFGVDFGR